MIGLVQDMWQRALTDQDLSRYFSDISTFMAKAVREPNYVTSQEINDDASILIDQGQTLLNIKYKDDTDALMHEGKIFIEKLNDDPQSREVAAAFRHFANDLLYDK
jgi:hypothetical protein